MNHGLIIRERDEIGARVWRLAMVQEQFVAAYIGRSIENRFRSGKMWREAYVSQCAPPACDSGENFGRYEPEYEEIFVRMCTSLITGSTASVIVSRDTEAHEAINLLDALDAESTSVMKRLWLDPRRKRRPRWRKVADLIRHIPVPRPWAYVLNYFYEDPCTLFLSESEEVVRLLEALGPDEVLERW